MLVTTRSDMFISFYNTDPQKLAGLAATVALAINRRKTQTKQQNSFWVD